ncbi:MAG TPA: glycosyltransferase family 4 protein [Bryobacteraceae bacterium]|nr:glycosyltransferase family 4 protein [Bryobacteraceae bacterium]
MLKINWFSPLPPAHTGIAHYAMQILPILARRHAVVIWTDQDQVAPAVRRIARVAQYNPAAPPWREINDGTVSIYHLGNDPGVHAGIYCVSIGQPGIVVLHDVSLHDFFFTLAARQGKKHAGYLAALQRWYGDEGRRAGEAYCAGGIRPETMAQEYPMTREAVWNALGVVTHYRRALEELHETPTCPSAALEFPYLASRESSSEKSAARGVARPPFWLVTFGYMNRNRRLGPLLEALAGMRERDQFRLDICGQIWDEGHIRSEIERFGLNSQVNLHGFLSENQLDHKLSVADLAVNLRFPSMGEASLSQLQYWNYGLPTLVTRTGWYASLPEEAAVFVRPEHEVEDIQAHLRAFLADPDAFRAMGERGRQALKNNDPEKYVDALTRFASEVLPLAPGVPALALARKIGTDMTDWLHPVAGSYLLDRASREICRVFGGAGHECSSSD